MKNLVNKTLTALVLASASTAAFATSSLNDSLVDSELAVIETSPKYLNMEDTYLPEDFQGRYESAPEQHYQEDLADPLVAMLEESTRAAE